MSSAHLSRRVFDRQLDRTRVLAQWRRGEVSPSSLLDAASPLLASAQVLGEPTDRVCPICQRGNLLETRWVHGRWLGEKSGTARSVNEIKILIDSFSHLQASSKVAPADAELSIHTVEVCLHCKWNFLIQREELTLY